MLDVEINRKKWIYGSPSYLRVANGNMCALGFVCKTLDINEEYYTDQGNLDFVLERIPDLPSQTELLENLHRLVSVVKWDDGRFVIKTTTLHEDLIHANDSVWLGGDDQYKALYNREAIITKLGKEAGINFTFVN